MLPIYTRIRNEISQAYIGDDATITSLIAAFFSGGHVLLEGVPGLAKTTLAKSLAQTLAATFHRFQFTMDLMPSDITGSNIYRLHDGEFKFIPGPVFTNILLADEINRAPARTQSALLEAMQENQVTVDGETHKLPYPFFVIATQNDSEERGTWPLPLSELDRFMFRIRLRYPSSQDERKIIRLSALPSPKVNPVITLDEFAHHQAEIETVRHSDSIVHYIADIIRETREDAEIELGASPRAGANLFKAARTFAWLREGEFITPDDVRRAAPLILNHRIVLRSENISVDDVIDRILSKVAYR